MILYHGSNMGIDRIDLTKGRRGKDFGQGFNLSDDKLQAQMMAERTVEREDIGTATLNTYFFDEEILLDPKNLKVKVFDSYSIDWVDFIILNRSNRFQQQAHDFDIVYGPIANDKVGLQLSRFQLHYIPKEELIRQLSYIHPTFQYFFGTERAVSLLKKIEEK